MHCYMAWFWLFIKVYKLVYDPPLMFGMANGQDNLPGAFRHRCREFHGCGSAAWHVLTGYGWLWFWDSVGGRVDLVGGFKHFLFPIIHGISRDNPSHWLIFFRGVETTNQWWGSVDWLLWASQAEWHTGVGGHHRGSNTIESHSGGEHPLFRLWRWQTSCPQRPRCLPLW